MSAICAAIPWLLLFALFGWAWWKRRRHFSVHETTVSVAFEPKFLTLEDLEEARKAFQDMPKANEDLFLVIRGEVCRSDDTAKAVEFTKKKGS